MPQLIKDSIFLQVIWAVGILLLSALIAWIILLVMRRGERRFAKHEKAAVVAQFLECLSRPVFVLILVQGLILSLITLPFLEQWRALLTQISISILIIIGTFGIARILSVALEWFLSSQVIQKAITLDAGFVRLLRRILLGIVYTLGLLILLDYLVPEAWRALFNKVIITAVIVLGTYGVARVLSVALEWYLSSRAVQKAVAIDAGLVRLLRRIMLAIIYVLGLLILLDFLDIEISPILAGLGIGGLAVALALQPLLSNFFAGTQIVSDRMVRVGDFIQLEDSLEGYVIDLGWRSTRIRTLFDTIVIIPNSKLAESTITNYHAPNEEITFVVESGVTYGSDLVQVESVVLQVAQETNQERDEAVKTFEPWFIYDECGDANINFRVWLRAKDYLSSLRLKSEFIKRLRARFQEEGIETTMITG